MSDTPARSSSPVLDVPRRWLALPVSARMYICTYTHVFNIKFRDSRGEWNRGNFVCAQSAISNTPPLPTWPHQLIGSKRVKEHGHSLSGECRNEKSHNWSRADTSAEISDKYLKCVASFLNSRSSVHFNRCKINRIFLIKLKEIHCDSDVSMELQGEIYRNYDVLRIHRGTEISTCLLIWSILLFANLKSF